MYLNIKSTLSILGVGLAIILSLIPFAKDLMLVILAIFYLILSVKKLDVGYKLLLFYSSIYICVRLNNFDSILLSGFREIIITIFIISALINYKSKNKYTGLYIDKYFLALLAICFVTVIIHSELSPVRILLAIRENLITWILLPFLIYTYNLYGYKLIYEGFYYLFYGVVFVSFLNLSVYYGFIDFNIPPTELIEHKSGQIEVMTRYFLGFNIERMNTLFGTGPGTGGAYYMLFSILGLFLFSIFKKKQTSSYLILFGIGTLTLSALNTASLSSISTILLTLIPIYFWFNKRFKNKISKHFIICLIIFCGILGLFSLQNNSFLNNQSYGSLVVYLWEGFLYQGISLIDSFSFNELIIGKGLALRSGNLVDLQNSQESLVSIDISWMIIAVKYGFFALILAIILIGKYLKLNIGMIKKKYKWNANIATLTGIILFGALSVLHTSPLIMKPHDFLIIMSISIIMYLRAKNYE